MNASTTLGNTIAQRRNTLGLSLKELGQKVHKEDGKGVSAQYLHDIERDRRTPSPHVLAEIAKAIGVEPSFLGAVAGQAPDVMTEYFKANPDTAGTATELFALAKKKGFTDWKALLKKVEQA